MEEKWLAVEKFHKLEQKKRDIMSTQLESMRKKQATASLHLDQLSVLKGQMKPKPLQSNGVGLHREAFINCSRVDQMLGKMILHQEQEQALMEAECLSLTHQLATKYKRVKILENTLEGWKNERRICRQIREDIALEENISSRFVQKA